MAQWIEQLMAQLGYAGIALLMLAETVFPPIPSEVIMPLAGMEAAKGTLSLPGIIAAGTAGAMAGNSLWYGLARWVGADRLRSFIDRHGRWLTLDWSDVERGRDLFARGGAGFVCLGRLLPTIRSIVSIPAGLLAMPFGRFFLWSFVGTSAWTSLLAGAGALLGQHHDKVAGVIGPISTGIIIAIAIWYIWRVMTWKRDRPNE
ncbi:MULTISPECIES: DedA family protein [Sphingomonadaceae]|jgi:membrane protein DedA with SNARE-associated domain|nr:MULTISPECIES: DedA family protein [Sphingomonadaceae]OUC52909.1 alkaline phosphatase [Sphingobium sp. GW456-12-10-14-TSB1]QCI92953.1 DedA family protein [Novosphingobium sp. EMRT-2]